MSDSQWVQLVVALLGGGAMGAIITALVTNRRNRVQPVGFRSEIIQVFKETIGLSTLQAQLKISDGQTDYSFDNLFINRLVLVNRGNADIQEFKFGVTLSNGDLAIYVEPESEDRHHVVTQENQVGLKAPSSEIDFILKPFNRRDVYSFNLFLVIPKSKVEPNKIQLSSQHSVKFVDMPLLTEVAKEVVIQVLAESLPFPFRFLK